MGHTCEHVTVVEWNEIRHVQVPRPANESSPSHAPAAVDVVEGHALEIVLLAAPLSVGGAAEAEAEQMILPHRAERLDRAFKLNADGAIKVRVPNCLLDVRIDLRLVLALSGLRLGGADPQEAEALRPCRIVAEHA